jgi:hypothetical protein
MACIALAAVVIIAGCSTSTRSTGLPEHIRTVEVHIFQNKTMYQGLEGRLTRQIIDRINMDPSIRVVSRGGDAIITGEITDVKRTTVRETTTDEPATVSLSMHAIFSFYDEIGRRYLLEDVPVSSSDSSSSAGLYEAARGESTTLAEEGASRVLAADIVRRTIGMW